MAPDLNSLPPSHSTSSSPAQTRSFPPQAAEPFRRETPSPRSSSVSLAAAATLNAADRSVNASLASPRARRASERRRSAVAMNLNLNDPTIPGPGELSSSDHRSSIGSMYRTASPTNIGGTTAIATGDPHHQRAPSLGEIHQELEQEQEAQVNRLLQMIRLQQAQLQQLQVQHQQHTHGHSSSPLATSGSQSQGLPLSATTSTAIDDSTPTSERSFSLPIATSAPTSGATTTLPIRPSQTQRTSPSPSPALRPLPRPPSFMHNRESSISSTSDFPSPSDIPGLTRRTSRDEVAYYQAETANLTRENQMLRHRIKELEKMLTESGSSSSAAAGSSTTPRESTEPIVASNLTREVSEEEPAEAQAEATPSAG